MKKYYNDTDEYNLALNYDLAQEQADINVDYEKMRKALKDVGVNLLVENGKIHLSLDTTEYLQKKRRSAGRPKTRISKADESRLTYTDVIIMLQTMTNKEIAAQLGMPINTFYRHRNEMLGKDFVQHLDKNKLTDRAYLESEKCSNFRF